MLDVVESGLNGLRMTPCPGCSERALAAPREPRSPCAVTCNGCGRTWDALADVRVVRDPQRLVGNCCSGFRRHELHWRQDDADGDGDEHVLAFETWAQDHVVLRPGDKVSLLFEPGVLARVRRRRRPMPLMVANHTMRRAWALAGSAPVATLR